MWNNKERSNAVYFAVVCLLLGILGTVACFITVVASDQLSSKLDALAILGVSLVFTMIGLAIAIIINIDDGEHNVHRRFDTLERFIRTTK